MKFNSRTLLKYISLLVLCFPVILVELARSTAFGMWQTPKRVQVDGKKSHSIQIRWKAEPKVDRYRLQVARDRGFSDIVFDRAVHGTQYVVRGLAPGNYFWRVAPAADETGEFSKAEPILITPEAKPTPTPVIATVRPPVNRVKPPVHTSGPVKQPAPPSARIKPVVVRASELSGWRTATGDVTHLVVAHLGSDDPFDVVGVNTEGTVYALNGSNGVALWTSRFSSSRTPNEAEKAHGSGFTPLIFDSLNSSSAVLAPGPGGLRLLRGDTGKEIWRSVIEGDVTAAVALKTAPAESVKIVAATQNPSTVYFLDSETGKELNHVSLDGTVLGTPVPVATAKGQGVLIALTGERVKGGRLEMRDADGERSRGVEIDTRFTTPPLVVEAQGRSVIWIGSERGLLAIGLSDLHPIGRLTTEDDMPIGRLVAAKIDKDGGTGLVMVTQKGRVVMVNASDGKIKWVAEGARDADSVVLADLNGDGALDVVVPADPEFAVGFSGLDGDLIWKAADEIKGGIKEESGKPLRHLVTGSTSNGKSLVIGVDPLRTSLRAYRLP